jgi:HEAT repeat protein
MHKHVRFLLLILLGLVMGGGCNRGKTVDEMIADLRTGKERDRIIAARLLPQHKEAASKIVPAMIESLKDRDIDVRLSAAAGLGLLGEAAREAIPQLQAAQKDRDARVRRAAGLSLSRIEGKK